MTENALYRARNRMSRGWCAGRCIDDDGKFCSVGALAVEMGLEYNDFINDDGIHEYLMDDVAAFTIVGDTEEAKILADTIVENYPMYASVQEHYGNLDVIQRFNDDQGWRTDKGYEYDQSRFGAVEAMFEKAAIKYDESNS